MKVVKPKVIKGFFFTLDFVEEKGVSKYMIKDFLNHLPEWFTVFELGKKFVFPMNTMVFFIQWKQMSEDYGTGKRAEWKEKFWDAEKRKHYNEIVNKVAWN